MAARRVILSDSDEDGNFPTRVGLSQSSVQRRLGLLSSSESDGTESVFGVRDESGSRKKDESGSRKKEESSSGKKGENACREKGENGCNEKGENGCREKGESGCKEKGERGYRRVGESGCRGRGEKIQQFSKRKKMTSDSKTPKRVGSHSQSSTAAGSGTPALPIQPRRFFRPRQDDGSSDEESKNTRQLLKEILKKMNKYEDRIDTLEKKLDQATSSAVKTRGRKNEVPNSVRSETRRIYNMLMEEDVDGFDGWIIQKGMTFKSAENQRTLDRLVREVKALNPDFLTHQISDAAYRYYKSCCEQQSAKRRGISSIKLKSKRKHERLTRKLADRKATLAKADITTDEYEKWQLTMNLDFFSSDDSDLDDEGRPVYVVKPLPWRSEDVDELYKLLDDIHRKNLTPQSMQQYRKCTLSDEYSSRPKPNGDYPAWLLAKD